VDVSSHDQVILELTSGIECDAQEPRKLSFAILPSALDNICGNGHRGSNQLPSQGYIVRPANPCRNPMSMQRQGVRFLPNVQFLEVAHSLTMPNTPF
jgi:hypothetical protein